MMAAGFLIIDLPVVLLQCQFTESCFTAYQNHLQKCLFARVWKICKNNLVASERTGPSCSKGG